jgi:hypothetical protein
MEDNLKGFLIFLFENNFFFYITQYIFFKYSSEKKDLKKERKSC